MRTPGHAVMNLAVLAHAGPPAVGAAVIVGAVLPDVPIVVLFLWQKRQGTPDDVIWRVHYQRRFWLNLIHAFHSFPLAGLGLAVSLLAASPVAAALFSSALLHDLLDLPVHGIDAHRHFFPLSSFRLQSPISYWIVTRHARLVTVVEWLMVLGASAVLFPGASPAALVALGLVHAYYVRSFAMLFLAPEPST